MQLKPNPNQERANRVLASGLAVSDATRQCLEWIATCPYDPRDTRLLDRIERDMRQEESN